MKRRRRHIYAATINKQHQQPLQTRQNFVELIKCCFVLKKMKKRLDCKAVKNMKQYTISKEQLTALQQRKLFVCYVTTQSCDDK